MKKLYLFTVAAIAICVIIFSCSKKSDTTTTTNPNAFDYAINNVQDVTVEQGSTAAAAWEVKLSKGTQESVTLAITGLPANVTATPNTTTGTPTYTASVAFAATSDATVGTSPITITSTSATTTAKTYKFNLIVKAPADCSPTIFGNYTATDACSLTGSDTYKTYITAGSGANKVIIHNLADYDTTSVVNATLDCSNNTITVPQQSLTPNITISGSGTFSATSLSINYTAADATNSESCTSTLVKH